HELLAPRSAPALTARGEVLDDVVELVGELTYLVGAEHALEAQVPVLGVEGHVLLRERHQITRAGPRTGQCHHAGHPTIRARKWGAQRWSLAVQAFSARAWCASSWRPGGT